METKPSETYPGGKDTGGGYERIRSYEYRPHTARQGKEDVYVAHHRLLAVVACYPDDMPVSEILDHMDGKDVHHSAPEVEGDRGVEWDNRPECLQVVEHGRHSEITQAEMRAWGEDAKQRAERVAESSPASPGTCDGCGEPADVLAESDDWSGVRCLACAKRDSDGAPIEL